MGDGDDGTGVETQEPRRVEDVGDATADLNQLARGEGDDEGVVARDDVDAVLLPPKDSHELGRELPDEEDEEVGEETSEDDDEEERRQPLQTRLAGAGRSITLALPFLDRLLSSSVDEGVASSESKSSDCLWRRT